jgi:FKBP-type peptidyl-prolyl cis-trans isomerase SlyD
MQITDEMVVAIEYTLTDDEGKVLDSSEGHEPLTYLHGTDGIIPGLERELSGKQVGDELKVAVTPQDGYGERDEDLRQQVGRDQFEGIEELETGMQFQVDSDNGPLVVEIIEIDGDDVTIDGNHPLAGVNLNFAVTIRDIRAATAEEIEHGHAHGPGGHTH